MTDVTADVVAIIAKMARPPRPNIQLTDRLEDLGVESLGAVELIFELEEKFDIQVPYNANSAGQEFQTVGDIVGAIKGLVAKA